MGGKSQRDNINHEAKWNHKKCCEFGLRQPERMRERKRKNKTRQPNWYKVKKIAAKSNDQQKARVATAACLVDALPSVWFALGCAIGRTHTAQSSFKMRKKRIHTSLHWPICLSALEFCIRLFVRWQLCNKILNKNHHQFGSVHSFWNRTDDPMVLFAKNFLLIATTLWVLCCLHINMISSSFFSTILMLSAGYRGWNPNDE